MTLPGNVTFGTVNGKFLHTPSGAPLTGTVTFTPTPAQWLDPGATTILLPDPVTATLDANGAFSQQLMATDDAALNPVNWTYTVTFALGSGSGAKTVAPFSISVPAGSTQDLSSLAPVPAANGNFYLVSPLGWHNVKDSGAVGDGNFDDTAAINAAIALGGTTYFPAGTYKHTGLTLPSGAHLLGVGAGYYGNAAPTSQRAILKLANGANTHSVNIPAGNTYGSIEWLEIDGNKANQTAGSGRGIQFADAGAGEEAGWHLRRLDIHDTAGTGIYVGNNRRAVYGQHLVVTATQQHGIHVVGSDSTWVKCLVGNPANGYKNIVAGGWVTRFIGGDVWGATGAPGIVVVAPLCSFHGLGIDRNGQEGILFDTGSADGNVVGCIFHSNGQDANNTYADIRVNQTGGTFSITGNNFAQLDTGITNKRKYAIQVGTNTAITAGNAHNNSATGTAYTDTPANLVRDGS